MSTASSCQSYHQVVFARTLFLHADPAGRPYSVEHFRDALQQVIDTSTIVSIGPYQMNHVWMATFTSLGPHTRVLERGDLVVNGRRCVVIDPARRRVHMRVLWLPVTIPDSSLATELGKYGTVEKIIRHKWSCAGLETCENLCREVVLQLKDGVTVDRMPHLAEFFGCSALLIIPGRPPLCLRCHLVGNVRRFCRTPRCGKCNRYGHIRSECVESYTSKLDQSLHAEETERSSYIMDAAEASEVTKDVVVAESSARAVDRESGRPEAVNTCLQPLSAVDVDL